MKRSFDLILSVSVFLCVLPFLLFLIFLIKLDSPGPAIFKQVRIGKDKRLFKIFKLRTMVVDAEKMGTGLNSYDDDPRITRVGRVLRVLSLDELPQIVNVILGDMSLVGPRPAVSYELGDLDELSPLYNKRFTVKPGITGLAQINGRNDLDWDQKVAFDNEYINAYNKFGIFYDFLILLKTSYYIFKIDQTIEKKK